MRDNGRMIFRRGKIGDLSLVIAQHQHGRMKTFTSRIAKAPFDQTGQSTVPSASGRTMTTIPIRRRFTSSPQVEHFATTRSAESGRICNLPPIPKRLLGAPCSGVRSVITKPNADLSCSAEAMSRQSEVIPAHGLIARPVMNGRNLTLLSSLRSARIRNWPTMLSTRRS